MYDYPTNFASLTTFNQGDVNIVAEDYNGISSSLILNGDTTTGSIGSAGHAITTVEIGTLSQIADAAVTFCEVLQFGALLGTNDQTLLYNSQKAYWGSP
ncbi:hypothetical protein HDG39_001656 [Paraburkholderia sp. WSM4180]|nr:hypothetical protein [Paraburkholderia sp. WSM4180]